jgi:hypothetical protein
MRRRTAILVCAGFALLGHAATALAQYSSVTPKRLVERYDFEDTNDQGVKLGRGLNLPPAWYPTGRAPQSRDPNFTRLPLHDRLSRQPGFPQHNVVGYSAAGQGAASEYSLRVGIDGGSAGAYLAIGALPAVPGSDYLVSARVRTEQLEHAGARLRAYFVDPAGRRLEPSTRATPRLRTAGAWTDIDLTLPGEYAEVAYIGIEVELVQPAADPRDLLGNHQLVLTDVTGQAWFDDIAVWQLPHVEIGTANPANVTRHPSGPFWNIAVRDLVGGRLTARLTVYDHAMNVVAEDRRPMGWGAPSNWRWSPKLPGFGWYLAELAVLEGDTTARRRATQGNTLTFGGPPPSLSLGEPAADTSDPAATQANGEAQLDPPATEPPVPTSGAGEGNVIARTYNAVLWLPPGTGPVGVDAEKFALVATGMDGRSLSLLPELARIVGLGSVIVSAWDRETTLGGLDLRLEALKDAIRPLKNAGRNVELSFSPVPEMLQHTRGINTDSPESVFAADPSIWMPYVQPILVRHGQRVRQWHLGSADRPEGAYLPELPAVVSRVYEQFRHWTPGPRLVVPWRLDQPLRSDLEGKPVAYSVGWPNGVTPDRLPDYLTASEAWAAPDAERRFEIAPPRADRVPHPARVTDLALRMVQAWEQDATGVALPGLWTPGLERRASLLPDPLLGVAANVATRLAGYRAIGRLPLGEHRVAVVFRRDLGVQSRAVAPPPTDDGLIVAWNLNAPADEAEMRLRLGDEPVAHDVWGNATPLAADDEGRHRLTLTATPVFVTGIDPKLALFRGSFQLDEPFVASTQTPHLRTLRLTNPWPVTVSGRFTITGPEDWTVKPSRHSFSIAPGDTIQLPIALKFPVHEVAGAKQLTADFDFTADRPYRVQFATPLRLGLEGVRFEASLALRSGTAPGTVDATVTCIVTNTGQEDLSLNVFGTLTGYGRKERLVPRLEPGQAVIRQFSFADAGATLRQHDIRLGVRETNGPAVLNQRVGVNDLR